MKKIVLLLAVALLISSSISVFLYASAATADPKYNWQIAVSGTGVLHPCVPDYGCNLAFQIGGWCGFSGTSSGAAGDCSLIRSIQSPSGNLSCEARFDVTAWHTAKSLQGPMTDFYIDSGTITVSPASVTSACAQLLGIAGGYHVASTGTSGVLTISASSDTHFPNTPGHYTVGGGPVTWTAFNLQVDEIPSK